ncbi:hypothetical protein LSTR_LSTR015621 [Laodelphax striatellus]|uniref:Uncharacterized protein n=1 Tax=Laodelphax striatellus TaxID=195883 RepID=A0A482X1I3_LAOST|nr:hypothetical protein LSTR_LSTR005133 [Laodelphax striatellus]RZF39704.1 hypothetical protein LSTR_LSTR015621 [Laodelphax striatellus]
MNELMVSLYLLSQSSFIPDPCPDFTSHRSGETLSEKLTIGSHWRVTSNLAHKRATCTIVDQPALAYWPRK